MSVPPDASSRLVLVVASLLVGIVACRTPPKDGSLDPDEDTAGVDLPDDDTATDDTADDTGGEDTGSEDGGGEDGSDDGGGDDGTGDDGGDGGTGDDGGDGGAGDDGGDDSSTPEEICNGVDDDGDGEIDEDACPDVVVTDPATGRAYMVVETPMMWFDAEAYCTAYGYTLATIDDEAENLYVWELIFDGEDGVSTVNAHTWVGLHEDVGGSWEWSAGDAVAYTAWGGLEITDDYGTPTYGQAAAIGDEDTALWFEAPQTWFHHAICESP